ncbi:antibiotic biosynthesis monooxygenase [Pedobacter chinensis]|nr:antibiotic biosynthesis monooxygenase [Pedobacter chinensis]
MKKKILFVVTSHNQKGNTGQETGFYLSEVAHPWDILVDAGYDIDFVSPKGGKAPIDGFDLNDPINKKFWENGSYRHKIENTLMPAEVSTGNYIAIHYAGGHGAMWDFADNSALSSIAAKIYESGGVVSAVCHGPAGLVNIKLSNGKYLVDGKKVNAFTNEEEIAVKLDQVVPFLLESKLIERGAKFEKSELWQSHVAVDQRLVTGQNPQSAKAVGEAVATQLKYQETVSVLTRYDVEKNNQQLFRNVLSNYVKYANVQKSNIMAEAYFEEENPTVLWTIERWTSKTEFDKIGKGDEFKKLTLFAKKHLKQPAKKIYVKDLEPLSKEEWHRKANTNDRPITIMLFVESKPGTENNFKEVYHAVMPQFRSEPGVINYQLSEFEDDSTKFVTYEKFRDENAFQYHLKFPPILPVLEYLNTSIKKQPFQAGLHRLVAFPSQTKK